MSFWIKLLSFLIWLPFLLLGVILLPFGLLYSFVLCVIATQVLIKKGRTVLIVHNSAGDPSEFLTRLQELNLPKERSLVLDYANHKSWPWWSLPTQLYGAFGPKGKSARFTPDYLPAVLTEKVPLA
jgi:hypothetical protein